MIAVDSDARAVASLAGLARTYGAYAALVEAVPGDFHRLGDVPALHDVVLDGVHFANALHFSPRATDVLADAARRLRADGRMIVVEYDGRPASRWLPYPLGFDRLRAIAGDAGLLWPEKLAERPSEYSGSLYSALLSRQTLRARA